jgi:hypothetical protein
MDPDPPIFITDFQVTAFLLCFRKLLEQPRPDGDGEQHAARPQHAEHVGFS